MANLDLKNVSKRYGEFDAVRDVTIHVPEGEFLALLGPSGCGKTTTMRMIAGFIDPTNGAVHLGGRDITRLPPWKRDVGLVFQNYALFPHMTVAENVAFGLEMRKVTRSEIVVRVEEALRLVRLGGYGDRLPRQLSGGQQQRVALARALVFRPGVLLLDEPLSNLDAKLREEVRIEIRELQRTLGITTVMVTHDQEEALTMADRLVVMKEGRIRQIGTQRELYETPADPFVASFVGRTSFLHGEMETQNRFRSVGGLEIHCSNASSPAGSKAMLALRPERLTISQTPIAHMDNNLKGQVEFVSYLGGLLDIHVRLGENERLVTQILNREDFVMPIIGDPIFVSWPSGSAATFPADAT